MEVESKKDYKSKFNRLLDFVGGYAIKLYHWLYKFIFQNILLIKSFLIFVFSQIKSQIEIMKDVNIESNFTILLIWSSLFLSIFSGYTTWGGIETMSNIVVAFIAMLGIQIMLFVSSWKMSYSFVRNDFNYPSLLIFAITLCTSIGFSYIALFSNVFDNEQKAEIENADSKNILFDIVNDINKRHTEILEDSFDNDVFLEWKKTVMPLINEVKDKLYDLSLKETRKFERAKAKAKKELEVGGFHEIEDGSKIRTDPGDGVFYKKLLSQQNMHKRNVDKYESLILESDSLINDLPKLINSFNQQKDIASLIKVDEIIGKLSAPIDFGLIAKYKNSYDKKLSYMFKNRAFSKISDFNSECSSNKMELVRVKEEILGLARKCTTMSNIPLDEMNNYIKRISTYERYNNQSAHKYMIALSELKNANPLALEVLFLASIFDLLILFASFIGARIENYSDIKTSKDIQSMGEKPLLTALNADLDDYKQDTNIQKRLKGFLRESIFCSELLIVGHPLIIPKNKIQALEFHYVLLNFIFKKYVLDKKYILARLKEKISVDDYNEAIKSIDKLTTDDFYGISLAGILWMLGHIEKIQESQDISDKINKFSKKVIEDI